MVEERVRFVTRAGIGRSLSDSQRTYATPASPAPSEASELETVAPSGARAFNLFDLSQPDTLPRELRMVQQSFGAIFAMLLRQFGFQEESIRNQQEHLLVLLANCSSREANGQNVLHGKLLSNYRQWAKQLLTTPQCAGDADVAHQKMIDLGLYLLIWGEAANLRHVPESLCFLFHQMRLELWAAGPSAGGAAAPNRPQGWFLSRVVAPLYRTMRSEMNRKVKGKPVGHTRKANYDDFNEFFWTTDCLRYSYYAPDDGVGGLDPRAAHELQMLQVQSAAALLETFGRDGYGDLANTPTPEVAKMPAIKRYVERRSWLHAMRSFWRIYAFHFEMLHAMLAIAACTQRTGVEVDGTLLQALCGILVTHSGLAVLREVVSLFIDYGMLHTHPKLLVSWLVRSVVKVALCGAIAVGYFEMVQGAPFGRQHVPPSEWTSRVLLAPANRTFLVPSCVYAATVAISTLAQVFPFLSTWVRSLNGLPKMLIDFLEPLNRLYVGKAIHTSAREKLSFDLFWLSLLTLKFWFSYTFQIAPLVPAFGDIWALDLGYWYPSLELGKLPNLLVCVCRGAPMLIMYMIDMQLWFMLWTAGVGTVLGWALRIGEVPSFNSEFRARFLDAAEHFNRKLLSDAVPLLGTREAPYAAPSFASPSSAALAKPAGGKRGGKGAPKDGGVGDLSEALLGITSQQVGNESLRFFSEAWNGVLHDMRQSDLLSNRELQMLLFNNWEGSGFSRATYLPVFCTAGKLNGAFLLAQQLSSQPDALSLSKRLALETELHATIGANVEMREACVEFWELGRWTLATALGERHEASLQRIVSRMTSHLQEGSLLDVVSPSKLAALSKSLVDLAKALQSLKLEPAADDDRDTPPALAQGTNVGQVTDKVRTALDALKAALGREARVVEELEAIKFTSSGVFWDEGYAAAQLARVAAQPQAQAKLRGLVALVNTAVVDVKPKHWEVQRRLSWFISSLFMDLPRPPPVGRMGSWSVMTPFCNEDILYSARELASKNEDGISVIYFLKTVHPEEWLSFLERVGVKPKDEAALWQDRHLALELRLWASFRGQTLARTVEGMMLSEKALRLQAQWEGLRGEALEQLVRQKFTYVVSCQLYGQHKRMRDPKAADTEFLCKRFPNLRVAYVDKTTSLFKAKETDGSATLRESVRFYSVLVKGAHLGDAEDVVQEVYRVQLPGDIMLGEGKPENQNHAMIFTRGEKLQTIDMNQCGYFEEALKMRNLLHEFVRNPSASIVGFREHIFTGTLSSLASYMALQEGCFVTLTQRVLDNPLKVRLHYGHPDIFDKLFSMTRGGVSKASRGINLSEDIYAGFNHLLRGGTIPYIEYVQVGKGRDVGMQQIYKFEAKLASGNGEQCLSRDVYRIGQRLDFTRLLSFYYSGIGFYLNNAMTVASMILFMYLILWSHVLQLDKGVPIADMLNAQWSLQLGLLLTVPILCYLSVEHGLYHALYQLLRVNATGSPLFFMFHMGTKAHYFDSTLKYGGAKYRPTGRGFVMRHEEFAELYRFYAASHLYNGFELLWGLLLLRGLGSFPVHGSYWRTCWSIWAVMVSWLFAPFWFNPSAFDMSKMRADLAQWQLWIVRKDASALSSWESWWYEEHAFVSTRSWSKKLFIFLPALRYALTAVGLLAAMSNEPMASGLLKEATLFAVCLALLGCGAAVLLLLRALLLRAQSHLLLRVTSTALLLGTVVAVPVALSHIALAEVVLLAFAAGYLFAALCRVSLALGFTPYLVRLCFLAYDYFIGGLLLLLCLGLSAVGFVKHVQNRALLSNTFAKGVKYAELAILLENKNA